MLLVTCKGKQHFNILASSLHDMYTVGRTGLWQLLRKYGCPEKFTTMIESLHTGMMVNVRNGGEVSYTFAITNGVKHGCVLAPRFSLYLCQQCLQKLSETWGTEFSSNHARMQTSLQLHTSERRQKPQIYL